MKLVLVNPPWKIGENSIFSQIGAVYPPLGIAFIAGVLKNNPNVVVNIIDGVATGISLEEYGEQIKKENPDVVGITAFTTTFLNALATAEKTKEVAPNCVVIMGGPHPTILPEEPLSTGFVDIVVRGEGEETMKELVSCNFDKSRMKTILGISFRDDKNRIIHNQSRPLIKDMDKLPMPAYDKLPMHLYRPTSGTFKRLPTASMITSRGCPFNCIYCSKAIFGKTYRSRSVTKVLEEMEYLINKYGIREITFQDDVFTMDMNRTEKICDMIIAKKLDITWSCSTRINLISENLLKKMAKAGCVSIEYGIESGDTNVLQFMRKGITIEDAKNVIKMTRKADIETRASYIIGMPLDNRETIKKTIQVSRELDSDFIIFNIAIPFPGTELYDIVKREGRLLYDKKELYIRTDGAHVMIKLDDLTERDIFELYKEANEGYYLRMNYIFKKILKIRSLNDIKRYKRGFFEILKWKL